MSEVQLSHGWSLIWMVDIATITLAKINQWTRCPRSASLKGQYANRTYSWFTLPYIASAFRVNMHQYANDTQLYVVVYRNDENLSTDALEKCSAAVNDWMLHNGLALNPDKSEAIMFRTSGSLLHLRSKVLVAGSAITISDKVKSLGVILDKCLTFDSQVKATRKAIHYHAR